MKVVLKSWKISKTEREMHSWEDFTYASAKPNTYRQPATDEESDQESVPDMRTSDESIFFPLSDNRTEDEDDQEEEEDDD